LLELLQRLGREEEFDQLALDYCVTFEVSPPAFRPVPSKPATGVATAVSTASSDSFELPAAMHAPLAGLQSRIIVYAAQPAPDLRCQPFADAGLPARPATASLSGNLTCTSIEFRTSTIWWRPCCICSALPRWRASFRGNTEACNRRFLPHIDTTAVRIIL
jgi:hypothetical protein